MKRLILALALVIMSSISNFAQQTPSEKLFEIKGIVKDQEKNPLAGLHLRFESEQQKDSALTDENGIFVVKLPVGKYKITNIASVSKKFLAFIEISDRRLNPNNFELTVEMNRSCCSPMSDGNETEVLKYVAPPFPPAAQAVRALGEVVVLVKIDSEGKVISAKAESGHPLLRAASEAAAKQWLFSSDKNAAERDGNIVFAFFHPGKKTEDVFTKPNRLAVFANVVIIDTSETH